MSRPKTKPRTEAQDKFADWARRMKKDWSQRASVDPYWAVLNSHAPGEWDVDEFMQSGEETVRRTLDPFMTSFAHDPGETCVEIGCGVGRLSQALSRRFEAVMALDVSPVMLEEAARNMKRLDIHNVKLVEGNGVDLSAFDDGCADCVYSAIVFQHIPDPEIQYGLIREAARVLKPGGYYMISLYADQKQFAFLHGEWMRRREAKERGDADPLMGWSEAARPELSRFETAMCNAVDPERMTAVLSEAGIPLSIQWHETYLNVDLWWIAGRKL